jgi:hypothetical protein
MSDTITATKEELKSLIDTAVTSALSRLGLVSDEISQREAYRRFGESWVKRALHTRAIQRIKHGDNTSKATYSLSELEALKLAERIHLNNPK